MRQPHAISLLLCFQIFFDLPVGGDLSGGGLDLFGTGGLEETALTPEGLHNQGHGDALLTVWKV